MADTWINNYDPNLNFNGETKLNVQGTEDIKTLVRFDLSSIPAGATITSATLSLYNYSYNNAANGGTLSVYRVNKPWVETQSLAVDDERLKVQVQLIDANSGNNLLGTPL